MAETTFGDEPQGHQGEHLQQQQGYRFTPDELRCLKECNRESFYFRSFPIGTVFAAGTYYAVRYGYFKGSIRFGAVPKMIMASLTGYFIGKFSYQQKCVEKIMQLPNSPLADILRKQRAKRGGFASLNETLSLEPGFSTAGLISTPDESYSSGANFSDVSDARPLTDSFDTSEYSGSYHENELQMREDTLPPKPPQFNTNYDDLRRQNREDYERKVYNSSLQGISDGDNTLRRRDPGSHTSQGKSQSQFPNSNPVAPNLYGDMWDDKTL